MKNNIQLNRNAIPPILFSFIKEELNFPNSSFFIKKNSGRNTFGINRYFRFIEEEGNNVYLPKGFIGKLIRFCREHRIDHSFSDKRITHKPALFSFRATLHSYQENCLRAIDKKDQEIIVAPPGTGKTVMVLKIVADKQQPTLIVVRK